jgi:hypothetical protein
MEALRQRLPPPPASWPWKTCPLPRATPTYRIAQLLCPVQHNTGGGSSPSGACTRRRPPSMAHSSATTPPQARPATQQLLPPTPQAPPPTTPTAPCSSLPAPSGPPVWMAPPAYPTPASPRTPGTLLPHPCGTPTWWGCWRPPMPPMAARLGLWRRRMWAWWGGWWRRGRGCLRHWMGRSRRQVGGLGEGGQGWAMTSRLCGVLCLNTQFLYHITMLCSYHLHVHLSPHHG